jgi:thioredoxin 1
MSEHIHYVTDDNFATEVLQSPQPVLVDYWAEWCGPCKMIAPILDEVAKEYAGKLKVAKLNIDDNQKTPAQYGIPTSANCSKWPLPTTSKAPTACASRN